MKNHLLYALCLVTSLVSSGQIEVPNDGIQIRYEKEKTELVAGQNGELILHVASSDLIKFKSIGHVRYSDFGAIGDGKIDDINAIASTHAFANQHNLIVKADDDATYYVGGKARTAFIKTDTEFGKASFIIDDTDVEDIQTPVFLVKSNLESFIPKGITSLKKGQKKIDLSTTEPCLITVTNDSVKQYKRFGLNQNDGHSQSDIFAVDENGHVDENTPIIWDFDEITEISALRIDTSQLNISGGHFTTIANQAESRYTYYSRNIEIERSNVVLDGLEHHITGEMDHGAPYRAFISIGFCSNVTVKNTLLTGHKTYKTIGNAGKPVPMGSYEININHGVNISLRNCKQTNSIYDGTYWGIMGTNYCKNLILDSCKFSRFDAHMGVTNARITNSNLGYMGVRAIGHGTFTIENTTVRSRHFIFLRQDYGSTWDGDFVIRNCTFIPIVNKATSISLIHGLNSGVHDFGYTCYMPENITIENLHIQDSIVAEDYRGPVIFSDFNPKKKDKSYVEQFPYVLTKQVLIKNVTTSSGKGLRVSENAFMFKKVEVKIK